ncbi:MAG: enoyl-CoA hydratase/isomerase family protein [Betaproteobacteria bacterium]|jgi:enoyl-CoA hydratase/carnithine racemase|nr:enoyl-CoA hydratase/isomerase family protein [Betaproteobacteria bacterium]
MSGDILIARDGPTATVTLSSPERLNALSLPMWEKLGDAMLHLDADVALRCIVLRGAGEKAFGAGADISEFAATRANSKLAETYGIRVERAMRAISDCRHPTVAMIHGACVGGGLLVASRCDIRIAGESARFGVPVKRLGLVESHVEMQGMLDLLGYANGLEMILEGRIWPAQEAYEKGLVNRVVPDAEVEQEALATARRIAEGAPLAARWHKKFARRLADPRPLTEAERDEAFACFDTEDFREGTAAFLEKRTPRFEGR